jgi:hypothetical protein
MGMVAGLTGLVGLIDGSAADVVADGGCAQGRQGVGSGYPRGPAGRDRCQNLHRQGQHDDRKKFP